MLRNPLYVYGEGEVNVPAHMNLGRFMVDIFWKFRENVALLNASTHEKLTYGEILKDTINIALSLTEMGVKRGDVIALYSENRLEYFSALIGAMCTGAIVTTINVGYTKDELNHVLNISKPKMIFFSPLAYKSHVNTIKHNKISPIVFGEEKISNVISYKDLVKDRGVARKDFEVVEVDGQTDTALILYSSGTTGLPKGVMLTHLNVIITCNISSDFDPKEMVLYVAPWFHAMGLMGVLGQFSNGSPLLYLLKFETNLYLQTIEKYRVAQIVVAPPILVALSNTQANYDVSTVKIIYCGSSPLRDDTIQAVKARFPNVQHVLQGYGLTESTLAVTRDMQETSQLAKIGGVGHVIPTSIVKVVDIETKKILGPNQPGEICVKGPVVMKGYINKDRRVDFDNEGFFRTGDIGCYDDDHYFFIVARLKELIKYKGYQVPPAEIEAVLLQHPLIQDTGVIGVPHVSGGDAPRAFVVLKPGVEVGEEDIKKFVAVKLSNPKHLRGGVQFVDAIPKNPTGKIIRSELRKMVNPKSKL